MQGVSTRKVSAVVEELCGQSVSKSLVSDLCRSLDPQVAAWRERDLSARAYPFVLVDGLVVRVREDGQVRQRSLLIATGINEDGIRRHQRGRHPGGAGFLRGRQRERGELGRLLSLLKAARAAGDAPGGLRQPRRLGGGLVQALHTQFQEAVWQRCQTHLCRNILDACPKAHHDTLHRALRRLFEADTPEQARQELSAILAEFGSKASKAVACLEAGFDDATAVLMTPPRFCVCRSVIASVCGRPTARNV